MTKDEAIARIAKRLRSTTQQQLTWAQFRDVVADIDGQDRKEVLRALQNGDSGTVGNALVRHVGDYAKAQAVIEATALLVDDVISLDELDKVI